jgi:hypothetical protein
MLGGIAAVVMAGCQQADEIRRYQVPKTTARLLGAIIPHGERTWFLKLVGPVEEIKGQEEAFYQFLRSIRFTDQAKEPIRWTVPEGWQQEQGAGLRYATFHLGRKDQPLELTVTTLGGESSNVLANVNRWRGQLGLAPITEAELAEGTKQVKFDGMTATVVDLVGSGDSAPMKR